MDNERHALENQSKTHTCETCAKWKQFNRVKGFCGAVNNWHDEILYDSWCEEWCPKL